jgi:CO/xanthine dehydrogenase FAD-binding subunit
LVRFTAHLEGPNTFRHVSTIGGTVATAESESELYAALLVHEAIVTVQSKMGERSVPLADLELGDGELVTAVTIDTQGQTAGDRVGRTPADKPIVSVVGRRLGEEIFLAVCGVAERPILVAADAIDQLNPPADFRGSSAYRKQMAHVLSNRVLTHLNLTQRR